jgi:hypothetical protein
MLAIYKKIKSTIMESDSKQNYNENNSNPKEVLTWHMENLK